MLSAIGSVTDFMSYLSICIPILFGVEMPAWIGDVFTMVTGMFSTVNFVSRMYM